MLLRYSQFGLSLTDVDGNSYTSGLSFIDLLYSGAFGTHTVDTVEAGRLDIIAWKCFNDCSFAELIAEFNQIDDQLSEVTPGRVLLIPVGITADNRSIIPFTYVEQAS